MVVLYARPLLLWADQPAALRTLVRQTLAAQVAEATGTDLTTSTPTAGSSRYPTATSGYASGTSTSSRAVLSGKDVTNGPRGPSSSSIRTT